MKIYTRTGDKGKTSLFTGQRVSKADLRVEAYGTIDELNSAIGVALAEISNIKYQISNIKKELIKIQKDLFEIGSMLANLSTENYTPDAASNAAGTFDGAAKSLKNRAAEFEKMIDEMTGQLPMLTNFILPGGGKAGSFLHFVRTLCRRTERKVVALSEKEVVNSEIIVYLNRLSDLLFTMARFVNHKEKQKETVWIKK